MKLDGLLNTQLKQTCEKRWGVPYPLMNEDNKRKARETCLQNHGVTNVFLRHDVRALAQERSRSPEVNERRSQTLKNNASERISRGKETLRTRYGVDHNFMINEVKQARKQTWLEHYGVDNPFGSNIIRAKIQATMLEHHGTEYYVQTDAFKQRMRETIVERSTKAHATMKRNGTYGKPSKPEEACYRALCELFGGEDIERQVWVHRWAIDFHVKSINTYVQLDGVYWHGLDRPLEVIAEHRTKRDVIINRKWLTDREQERWFAENGHKLVRITDVELRRTPEVLCGLHNER